MKAAFITSKRNKFGRRFFVYVRLRKNKSRQVIVTYNPILAAIAAARAEA